MIPGQEEAVEFLANTLLHAWVHCGLIPSGSIEAYPRDQQSGLMGEARFQARSILGAHSPKFTSAELTKALA